MTILTYSLKANDRTSDRFFETLTDFTAEVVQAGERRFGGLLADFQEGHPEDGYTAPELVFDLLVIGTLWRVYAPEATQLPDLPRRVLAGLVHVRRNYAALKPLADSLRGALGWLFGVGRAEGEQPDVLGRDALDRLTGWLEAAGEFREEVKRMKTWQAFLSSRSGAEEVLAGIESFGEWFEQASLEALGAFTPQVEAFLAERHPRFRGREDYVFTGRRRVEYHLYMVGAEIMNQAYREAFLETEKRILFVPPCMAAPQDGKCQAKDTPLGARCSACTPACQVHQATKLGEKLGVEVFMIPDSFSPLGGGDSPGAAAGKVGVVGVSCPLTITGGGWEMRRMGIPAQGLLLDHCGCSWHWDPGKGIVTEINFGQVRRILGGQDS